MNIEICENLPFKDEISSNKDINSMIEQDTKLNNSNKNYIKIFDKNNNLLITKTNKVVQKFRINLLEQLFHSFTITNGDNSLNFSKDWISVFGVGTGGTPPSEGLNPYIVNPKTEDLSEKLLFTDSIFNKILASLKNKEKQLSLGTFSGMYTELLCRYLIGYGYSVKTIKIDKYPPEWEIQINLN
jgi:hypothetical protein